MTSTRDLTEAPSDQRAELDRLRAEVADWRRRYEKGELRDTAFTNSAAEVDPLYTALDVASQSAQTLGVPGTYPYTRGIHPTGYRGRLWTMRQ
ncbi:MAG TPA: methylmalonyl-CoA mutase family protein, partial [Gemmatimonadaceae bacterium]|nr:methylmalonyl-CoA mutase family protein [Gemmatimonadaceae bacterium]